MSPRRRLLVAVLVVFLLAGAGVIGVQLLPSAEPPADPMARPAQDRPGPVLLVPGYGGSRAGLQRLAARIEATGRSATVLTLVGDGTGDLSAQVAVLDAAVDAALAGGAPSVDVVGYSAGGVVAGLWVARDDGAAKARRVVTLGAPLAGTSLAATASVVAPDACPAACRQLAPGSAEITELARDRAGEALPWLAVWTADDETVTPPEAAARLAGAVEVQVQAVCPGARVPHSALPTDAAVTGLVLRALSADPLASAVAVSDCADLRAAG
jgi:triacylglycerol esterase/lipase EstA (alpha/beta hydrolase family)